MLHFELSCEASAILALRRRAWSTTNSFLIGVMPRGAITSASSIGRAQKHRPVARRSIFDGLTTRTDGWEVKIGNPACFKCYLCRQPFELLTVNVNLKQVRTAV